MGYLLQILIALGSLTLETSGIRQWPWAVAGLIVLPYALSTLERRCSLAGNFRLASSLGRLASWLPVLLQYAAVGLLGWSRTLEGWFGAPLSLSDWPSPEQLVLLLPYVVYTLASIDAEARAFRASGIRAGSPRGFHSRMFLTGLAPIVAYILLASLAGQNDVLRTSIQEVSLWSLVFTGVLGMAFILGLPAFLRTAWDTQPLASGPQQELLERVAALAKFRCREVLLWNTNRLVANAAIVGLLPGTRRVFFTDALLAQMGPRQLAAVYAHEIGHAKRRHVFVFLSWTIGFFLSFDLFLQWLGPQDEWTVGACVVSALVLWLIGFGWLSRRIELEADLYSLELLRDGIGITSALQAVGGTSPHKHSWRHFSTQARVAFLNRVTIDPGVGHKLRRKLRAIATAGLLLAIVSGSWSLVDVAQDYPIERVVVDLRLARYASASDHLPEDSTHPAAEDLRALVVLAQSEQLGDLQGTEQGAERTAHLARQSLREGDLERAAGWLALASYCGDEHAGRAARWLMGLDQPDAMPRPSPDELGPWDATLPGAAAGD